MSDCLFLPNRKDPGLSLHLCLGLMSVVVFCALIQFQRMRTVPPVHAAADVLYDVSIARHLLKGQGFVSDFAPLGAMTIMPTPALQSAEHWPVAHKFPLSQIRLAFFGAVFDGFDEWILQISSLAPYVVLNALLFVSLLSNSPFLLALILSLLFPALDVGALATSGLSYTTDALLFFVFFCVGQGKPFSLVRFFCLGIVMGLLILNRYTFALFAPFPVAALVYSRRSRATKPCLAYVVGCLLLAGPWVFYSLMTYGKIFPNYLGSALVLFRTELMRIDPWYLVNWPDPMRTVFEHPEILLYKLRVGVYELCSLVNVENSFPLVLAFICGVFGALGKVVKGDARSALFLIGVLIFSVVQLLLSGAFFYFSFLAPCMIWYSSQVLQSLPQPWKFPRFSWVIGPIALIMTYDTSFWCYPFHSRVNRLPLFVHRERAGYAELSSYLRGVDLPENSVVMAGTQPWELAPDLGVRVLPLAAKLDDISKLNKMGVNVALIAVGNDLNFAGAGELPNDWINLRWMLKNGKSILPGYEVRYITPSFMVLEKSK